MHRMQSRKFKRLGAPQTPDLGRPPQDARDAGQLLVEIVGKLSRDREDVFFNFELHYLEELFAMGEQDYSVFGDYHVDALRCCGLMWGPAQKLLGYLLQKGKAQPLFAKAKNVLQVLIQFLGFHVWPSGFPAILPVAEITGLLPTLTANGADISSFDDDGGTPMFYACYYGLPSVFDFLVDAGADISTTHSKYAHRFPHVDPRYRNPMSWNLLDVAVNSRIATRYSLDERWGSIILYLLDRGLECDPRFSALVDVLHLACFQGNIALVKALLHHGIDVNSTLDPVPSRMVGDFSSPLHAAAMGGRKDLVPILIDHGANIKIRARIQGLGLKRVSPIERVLSQPGGIPFYRYSLVADSTRWPDDILKTCAVLVQYGAGVEDTVRFMCACARKGRWSIMASILRPVPWKPSKRETDTAECIMIDGCEKGSEAPTSFEKSSRSDLKPVQYLQETDSIDQITRD